MSYNITQHIKLSGIYFKERQHNRELEGNLTLNPLKLLTNTTILKHAYLSKTAQIFFRATVRLIYILCTKQLM